MAAQPTTPTHLIAIGSLGSMRCYLGLSEDDAKARYLSEEHEDPDIFDYVQVKRVDIVNGKFEAYDVWPT